MARQKFLQNMALEVIQSSFPSEGTMIHIEKEVNNLSPDEFGILALDILHGIGEG
jgi:hypothetical protein